MKITAIIPTFNEELHIEDAIKSVSFADEIIVIDSFSSDKTVELAKKYDVNILQRVFDDFSTQKNFAISKAKNEWIYILDADERVTPKLKTEILNKVKEPKNSNGFYVYRSFYFMGEKINFSGFQRDKVVRLFLKKECFYKGKVHEELVVNGKTEVLKNKLIHYSYNNYQQFKTKLNKYAKLQALELIERNQIVTPYHLYLKPFIRFCIHYFLRLGFLDGKKGIIISYLFGYGVYRRYVELLKLK